jgi:hypothetical protein
VQRALRATSVIRRIVGLRGEWGVGSFGGQPLDAVSGIEGLSSGRSSCPSQWLYLQMTFIFILYVLLPAAVAASVQAAIVGKVIFVVLAFLCLSLGFNAYRMVTAIAADHRSALCAIG